jgi:hypothetical protein
VRTGMIQHYRRLFRNGWLQIITLGFLGVLAAGCGASDGLSPSPESPLSGASPADSAVSDSISVDTTSVIPPDSVPTSQDPGSADAGQSAAPGIAFGSFGMKNDQLGTIHTSSFRAPGPVNIIDLLTGARAKGARLVLALYGNDGNIRNADGSFSFSKWKDRIYSFKNSNFGAFISDGTVLVHYLIDEPNNPAKWGGNIVPQATVEAMAQFSKQLWPNMITLARVDPTWLASASVDYTYLDTGWAQYRSSKGDPLQFITTQVAAAKSKGLGLMMGLNVLNGGDGSSGLRGSGSQWQMSADELRSYGTTLLNQSYACGFMMWEYNATYFGRSDMTSAMADLSARAKTHAKTSCRQ